MLNPNSELPQNLQELLNSMNLVQAIPLGTTEGIPYVAIKLSTQNDEVIRAGGILCEFRASIFNVQFKERNIAICFVQFRLNSSDQHIFTASYDLTNDKQYKDCYALLGMKQYGILVMTDNGHDFLQFDVDFKGDFNPQVTIHGARELGDSDPQLFSEVSYALSTQGATPAELWKFLEQMAPYEKRWYARMSMGATKEA